MVILKQVKRLLTVLAPSLLAGEPHVHLKAYLR